MRFRVVVLAVGLAVSAFPGLARAQGSPRACLAPAPAARCTSWFITEAGARLRLSDQFEGEQDLFFHYGIGWMRNLGARSALGVQAFGGSDGRARGGVAVRGRQWLARRTALDLLAGIHLAGDASGQDVAAGSPSFQVRLGWADHVAVVGSLDVLRLRCPEFCEFVRDPNTTRRRAYLGVETGSVPGLLGIVLTAVGFGVVAVLYEGS